LVFNGFFWFRPVALPVLQSVSKAAQGNDWVEARSPAGGHYAEEKANRTGQPHRNQHRGRTNRCR
jgi:hypothetical protein